MTVFLDRKKGLRGGFKNLPSKMLPIIPGPNSTDKGLPVLKTGSPTVTPAKKGLRKILELLLMDSVLIYKG